MFIFGNFIHAMASILSYILTIYVWIIIIRALISWVTPDPYNPIVQFLYRITEPVLAPIRYRLPDFGGFDISPIVLILIIFFLQSFFIASLYDIARLMK